MDMTPDTKLEVTDGFHLVDDALKLMASTRYSVSRVSRSPISHAWPEGAGMRVISFRHEQTPATLPLSPVS